MKIYIHMYMYMYMYIQEAQIKARVQENRTDCDSFPS